MRRNSEQPGFSPEKSGDVEQMRSFLKSMRNEILTADPQADRDNYGSTIVVMLVAETQLPREEIVGRLVQEYQRLNRGTVGEDAIIAERERIDKTIANLLERGVVAEYDGVVNLGKL